MYTGLRLDDFLDDREPAVMEAFKHIPRAELESRQRRQKRAVDLYIKKETLPEVQFNVCLSKCTRV